MFLIKKLWNQVKMFGNIPKAFQEGILAEWNEREKKNKNRNSKATTLSILNLSNRRLWMQLGTSF